jgi:formylglycine-generating enzyme required for sulfatase activity
MDLRVRHDRGVELTRVAAAVLLGLSLVIAIPSLDAETPRLRADAWWLPDDPLLGFTEIPAGSFLMGSDPAVDPQAFDNERWSAEARQGLVDLPAFYLGRYEVTTAQFRAFVEATGFSADPQALAAGPDHPVSAVSWPDALAYCRWLDRVLRDSPLTPPELAARLRDGWSVSLPTEAQWERAARGGDGRIYPWGNEPNRDRANYGRTATTAVGSVACPECAFGVFDMSGNVWEWTRSPYQPYPYTEADDRDNLDADALWVMRGGHFGDPEQNVRAATRGGADPGARRPFIGFRLAIARF